MFVGGGAAAAVACARAGIHAIITSPHGVNVDEWDALARDIKTSGVIIAVARPLFGWAQARKMHELTKGLGRLRQSRVVCAVDQSDTLHGGLALAEMALEWTTGVRAREVCGDLATVARIGHFVVRCEDKSRALVSTSAGNAPPGVLVEVDGDHGALRWSEEHPDELHTDHATTRGVLTTVEHAGALGALASVYRGIFEALRARRENRARRGVARAFPSLPEIQRSARFVEAASESVAGGKWVGI